MYMQVLGPLEVRHGETSIVPSAAKPRTILALLGLSSNQFVDVATLMREVWGDRPPKSAATAVQTYVWQLRKLIGEAVGSADASDVLVTKSFGYLLAIGPDELDLGRLERAKQAGRRALAAGDFLTATSKFQDCLRMWRGRALADVQCGPALELEVNRMEECRINTTELKVEAELRLGQHDGVLGTLTSRIVEHPLRESFHAQHMLALHRCGRRAEALGAYHQLRHRLVSELGIEPSAQVQRLHGRILSADPALDNPGAPDSHAWNFGDALAPDDPAVRAAIRRPA
jgi:DNA-binding SARP family transcriptional activator